MLNMRILKLATHFGLPGYLRVNKSS